MRCVPDSLGALLPGGHCVVPHREEVGDVVWSQFALVPPPCAEPTPSVTLVIGIGVDKTSPMLMLCLTTERAKVPWVGRRECCETFVHLRLLCSIYYKIVPSNNYIAPPHLALSPADGYVAYPAPHRLS